MYILRSLFVISGSSLYPGFIIVRVDCIYYIELFCDISNKKGIKKLNHENIM